jgi:2-keto-3-deoxy-L-rhamnonate aldolase RhmA
MRTNFVKQKLQRHEPALGAWLSLPSVLSARLMAHLGFDWLLIDMEHTAHNPVLMADMVATITDAGTCAPIVRVPTNSVEWFKWALDAGAWGVMVPMVNTREDAERIIEYTKYPPTGRRSNGGVFAPYGFGIRGRTEYTKAANDEILVVAQIESVQALQNLDEILSVPGLDVAFIGPNDLHMSLGLPPSSDGTEPAFMEALERIKTATQKHNVALGILSGNGEQAAKRVQQGFHMISVTSDIGSMITSATYNIEKARGG